MGFGLVVVALESHLQLLVQVFFTLVVEVVVAMLTALTSLEGLADLEEEAMAAVLVVSAITPAILQQPTVITDHQILEEAEAEEDQADHLLARQALADLASLSYATHLTSYQQHQQQDHPKHT
jgi:hypothetical protein